MGEGRGRCWKLCQQLDAIPPFCPQLHAQAYVKLHALLQTAVPMRREEACYVLSKLEAVLARALNTSPSETAAAVAEPPATAAAAAERCSWLVPLVRTLLDRAYEPLGLQWGLPSLPPTNGSPTFFEDFQAFCCTPEWRHFIDKQVPGGGGHGEEKRGFGTHFEPGSPLPAQSSRCSLPCPSSKWTPMLRATTSCRPSGTPATTRS